MHYLITGGSGFIGRQLCRELLEQGHAVSVLTRAPAAAARVLPGAVRLLADCAEAAPADAVINLAGAGIAAARWSPARKRLLLDSRLQPTRRLLQWLAAARPRPAVLVSASAVGYYGARGDAAADEDTPSGDGFGAELCRRWEAEAQQAEALGLRVCRLRTGIVLGCGGGALARLLPAFRLGLGGPLGDGRQWMSWVHLQDLCALIRWLAERPDTHGAYNGTAPHAVRNAGFTRELAQVLRRPAPLRVPAAALRLLFGEMSELLLTGQNAPPRHALEQGFSFRFTELEMALREVLQAPA